MRKIAVVIIVVMTASIAALPARAQIAVIDAANLIRNTLTAARSLEQIYNQIKSLENEAVMLINEAKNLTSINYNVVNRLWRPSRRSINYSSGHKD